MRLDQATVLLAVIALAGCQPGGARGSGAKYETPSDLKPTAMIPAKANLRIGELDLPVEVEQTESGDKTTIALKAHGQVFEKEVYGLDQKSLTMIEVAGEMYEAPLPLLQFPLRVGDGWTWSGTMTAGQEPHKATAKIATAPEQILLPGGSTPSILVVVDLAIESGASTPATRKLRFWFVEGKGLVKRQFGIGSSREPTE